MANPVLSDDLWRIIRPVVPDGNPIRKVLLSDPGQHQGPHQCLAGEMPHERLRQLE